MFKLAYNVNSDSGSQPRIHKIASNTAIEKGELTKKHNGLIVSYTNGNFYDPVAGVAAEDHDGTTTGRQTGNEIKIFDHHDDVFSYIPRELITATGGSTTTFVDTNLKFNDDELNGGFIIIVSCAASSTMNNRMIHINDYTASTGTITLSETLPYTLSSGDTAYLCPGKQATGWKNWGLNSDGTGINWEDDNDGESIEFFDVNPETFTIMLKFSINKIDSGNTINAINLISIYPESKIIQSAINLAYTSGKKVIVPPGTYTTSEKITIKENVNIEFIEATIKPDGNFDVIQIKPKTKITGLTIDCSEVPGWDSSAIVIYGGDTFRGYDRCYLKDITLINTVTGDGTKHTGNGIKMYCDVLSQAIEFLNFENIYTQGFGKGIYIHSTIANSYTNSPWINGNNFSNYKSFKDTNAIYIDCKYQAEGNIFSNFQIQGDYYGSSEYAIYCKASRNKFSGSVYDWGGAIQTETGIYIASGSINNYINITSQSKYSEENIIVDYGTRTVIESNVTKSLKLNKPNTCDEHGMNGIQDNFLSYADKKFTCTLTGTPAYGGLTRIFDPNNYLLTPFSEQTIKSSYVRIRY
jgi:hypothetical protein